MARLDVVVQRTRSKRVNPPATPTPVRPLLPHAIPHKLFKLTLVVVVPSRQGGSILRHIAHRPSYSQIVQIGRDVVVRANDVKVAVGETVEHVRDGLFRGPGCVWFGQRPTAFSRMNPTGAGYQYKGQDVSQQTGSERSSSDSHEKVSATSGISDVAQLVRQLLGQGFDGGLGAVVRGVAWRTGDTLLGTGVDDDRGVFLMGPGKTAKGIRVRGFRVHETVFDMPT
jgi:hypothetical protein